MAGATERAVFRFFAIICIFVQMVAVVPHHHHDETGSPCINIFHRTGGHDSDANEGIAHSHDCPCHEHAPEQSGCCHDTGNGKCSFEHKDIIHSARNEEMSASTPVYALFFCETPGGSDTLTLSRLESAIALIDSERNGGISPPHTLYIVAAVPARAPSFTV